MGIARFCEELEGFYTEVLGPCMKEHLCEPLRSRRDVLRMRG